MAVVRDVLADAVPRLSRAGVDSPRLDAEVLLAHLLGHDRTWLWLHPDAEVSPPLMDEFAHLLARREGREPLAYLLEAWEFYGRSFEVTPAVLVPRPETELLVETVLAWGRSRPAARVADIGTGSGVIAITLALEWPSAMLVAVDLSPHALVMARRNAVRHRVEQRITFLEGDLLQPIDAAGLTPLDALVANLPYIAEEEIAGLMPEVREFEPKMALRAGEGGLALIRRLMQAAPGVLGPGGLLALEVGEGQAACVADELARDGWQAIAVIPDYAGIPRIVRAERASAL